jgi:hypothetical protein
MVASQIQNIVDSGKIQQMVASKIQKYSKLASSDLHQQYKEFE